MTDGETLKQFIDNQKQTKISVAQDLKISKQTLFQYFQSQQLEVSTKKKFEDYFGKKIFSELPQVQKELQEPAIVYEGKSSLEKSIENLTQNELRTTAIIERLVNLLEQQYQLPGPHNMDKNGTEDLRQKKTSSKAG